MSIGDRLDAILVSELFCEFSGSLCEPIPLFQSIFRSCSYSRSVGQVPLISDLIPDFMFVFVANQGSGARRYREVFEENRLVSVVPDNVRLLASAEILIHSRCQC